MAAMRVVRGACMAGLLALGGWCGGAAALTLDQSVLSASGTGGLIHNADQWLFTSSSLIQPTNAFGGFNEVGVLKVTGFLDAAGQPVASGVGSAYGLYVVFNLFGNVQPVPGTPNQAITFTSGDVKLWADRNNDSSIQAIFNPVTGSLAVDRQANGDDRLLADNTANKISGATLLTPSATGIPGLLDGSSHLGFASWILPALGTAAFGNAAFAEQLFLDSATLGPLLPVLPIGNTFILSATEAGVVTFSVPEPGSLALVLGGVPALAARVRRRVGAVLTRR